MAKSQQKAAQNRKKLDTEERRIKVAAYLVAGKTYREIAKALDVSKSTIGNDYQAIIKEWKEQYADKAADYVSMQMNRYNRLLGGVWDDAEAGELPAVDRALQIMDRINRILKLEVMVGETEDRPMHIKYIVAHPPTVTEDGDTE